MDGCFKISRMSARPSPLSLPSTTSSGWLENWGTAPQPKPAASTFKRLQHEQRCVQTIGCGTFLVLFEREIERRPGLLISLAARALPLDGGLYPEGGGEFLVDRDFLREANADGGGEENQKTVGSAKTGLHVVELLQTAGQKTAKTGSLRLRPCVGLGCSPSRTRGSGALGRGGRHGNRDLREDRADA